MSDITDFDIRNVKSEKLQKYFEKLHGEFFRTKEILKTTILTHLLTLQHIKPFESEVTIVVPLLQKETEVGQLARSEVCIAMKSVGIQVVRSGSVDNKVEFVIGWQSVTRPNLQKFKETE